MSTTMQSVVDSLPGLCVCVCVLCSVWYTPVTGVGGFLPFLRCPAPPTSAATPAPTHHPRATTGAQLDVLIQVLLEEITKDNHIRKLKTCILQADMSRIIAQFGRTATVWHSATSIIKRFNINCSGSLGLIQPKRSLFWSIKIRKES